MGLYSRERLEKDLATAEAFDQEVSRKVAAGTISGFDAVSLGREVEKKIRSLRMKLVNAGQLIADLRAAKSEMATAESESQVQRAKYRLRKTWAKIRFNSDGRGSDTTQDGPGERPEAPRSHEVSLHAPEAQGEIQRAVNARKRLMWRPGGRDVVVIYED